MIDRQTVEKILDTADIVDVVSDYVSLKKRGANWVGLCPFHNDRKPSFYVTRTKGFCKCFSCGEGGSPVNFIMKIENMSYPEALRYLAKKYNIEIEEKELTDEERQQQSEQESMFVINEFAMGFFEKQLHDTQEGVDVGLSYFRERGFSDESIHNFHLGYSPDKPTALHDAAVKAGYNAELLIKVGLCGKDERGWYDKFRGRVIFPIFTKSGKVVAFGGRTLHNHHAKYINSPESAIYHKRKTIYGLAQAKREIAKLDKCFIVEGYADVISMHQAGFKNVIATSGTALTKEHIYAIRNLTNNVTELFDGDEAGIKAAIKGVDMLLKQDLNIKVLVLPSPEDPDSFAQNHSASEITEYINQNEQDFIDFKTDVLLKDCERDPIARAKAIESVLRSVANIPNQITRNVYAQVCVNKFHLSESVIVNQIERYRAQIKEEDWKNEERERKQRELDAKRKAEAATTAVEVSGQGDPLPPPPFDVNIPPASYPQEGSATQPPVPQPAPSFQQQPSAHESALQKCEYEVIQYMVKYGCSFIFEYEQITVIEWLTKEITDDNHRFTIPLYQKLYKLCQELFSDFTVAFNNFMQSVEVRKNQLYTQEIEQFRSSFEGNVEEIERKEEETKQAVDAQFENEISEYRQNFIFKHLSSHPDDDVREIVNEICLPKHSLSKIHAEMFSQHMDSQRLLALVSASLFNWKLNIISLKTSQLQAELMTATEDRQFEILKEIQELTSYRKELAKLTGERVVNPKNLN